MWKKIDKFCDKLPEGSPVPLADKHPEVIDKTPLELFEQLFDNDCFTYFKQQFELYVHREKNAPLFSTSVEKIRKYFGILLLSGYHTVYPLRGTTGAQLMTKDAPLYKRQCHVTVFRR